MDYLESIMSRNVIQGLTEFLPISSSGHLEISKVILGNTIFQIKKVSFLQLFYTTATAFSTIFLFQKRTNGK